VLDPLEPVLLENRCVLCVQQSPGDSAGPEVDVAPSLVRDRPLDRHIGDLEPSSWDEYPVDLAEDRILVRG